MPNMASLDDEWGSLQKARLLFLLIHRNVKREMRGTKEEFRWNADVLDHRRFFIQCCSKNQAYCWIIPVLVFKNEIHDAFQIVKICCIGTGPDKFRFWSHHKFPNLTTKWRRGKTRTPGKPNISPMVSVWLDLSTCLLSSGKINSAQKPPENFIKTAARFLELFVALAWNHHRKRKLSRPTGRDVSHAPLPQSSHRSFRCPQEILNVREERNRDGRRIFVLWTKVSSFSLTWIQFNPGV